MRFAVCTGLIVIFLAASHSVYGQGVMTTVQCTRSANGSVILLPQCVSSPLTQYSYGIPQYDIISQCSDCGTWVKDTRLILSIRVGQPLTGCPAGGVTHQLAAGGLQDGGKPNGYIYGNVYAQSTKAFARIYGSQDCLGPPSYQGANGAALECT